MSWNKEVAQLEELGKWMMANFPVIVLVLLAVVFVLLITFVILVIYLRKTTKRYKALMKGVQGQNLEEGIWANEKKLQQVFFEMNVFRERLEVVEEIAQKSIQKVGLLRFDAFEDTGGELSYALALLDKNNSGVVVSSIFGRDDARTYCKYIVKGKAKQPLSAEEEKAIRKSLGLVE